MATKDDLLSAFVGADAPPEQAAAAAPAGKEDLLAGFVANTENHSPEAFSLEAGVTPHNALPESPLGIIDRARLGWVRTPDNQKKVLENSFGKENVAFANGAFSVKQEGKWYQADPHFEWDMKSLKDFPGDVAQYVGEYGLRSTAAAAAAAPGALAGAAAGAPLGPIGSAAGAAIGALTSGGVAAMGAEAADLAARAVGPTTVGSDVGQGDLANQMMASFMFGVDQEAMGGVMRVGGHAAIGGFKKAIETISDTPAGRAVAAKIVGSISGVGEHLARIRVDNPAATAAYDNVAKADLVNRQNKLGDMMRTKLHDFMNQATAKLRGVGKQFDEIEAVAAKEKFIPEGIEAMQQALAQQGYINPVPGRPGRDLAGGDAHAVTYLNTQLTNMQKAIKEGGGITYQELKNVRQSLDNMLYQRDFINDANLRRLLTEARAGLKQTVTNQLAKVDARTGSTHVQKFLDLNAKYGPAREMLDHLNGLSEGARVDGFLKKIIKDDGSFDTGMVKSLGEHLGVAEPGEAILQMHVARKSTKLWGGHKVMGIPVGTPAGGAALVSGFSGAKQAGKQFVEPIARSIPYAQQAGKRFVEPIARSIPYAQQGIKAMKSLDIKARKQMLQHPDAMHAIFSTIGGAAVGEKEAEDELLRAAGVH